MKTKFVLLNLIDIDNCINIEWDCNESYSQYLWIHSYENDTIIKENSKRTIRNSNIN